MPWIPPSIAESVVYLYPSEADAEDGVQLGGSGFLIGVPVGPHDLEVRVYCVVTNKHVVEGGSAVVRLNNRLGGVDIVALDGLPWFYHPEGDDLALCPIRLTGNPKFGYVPTRLFLTKELIEDLDIGPGDDVIMVGRFINHEGRQQNSPSVRFGNIAQMPWEPIMMGGFAQESFLIEARSISGYSGSPIFVHVPPQPAFPPEAVKVLTEHRANFPGWSHKRAHLRVPVGPWLLGVDFCHLHSHDPLWDRVASRPVNEDWVIKTNTGMLGAVPAWKLMEIVEGAEMKPIIDAAEKEVAKIKVTPVGLDCTRHPEPPAPDAETYSEKEAEERFEATLRGAVDTNSSRPKPRRS
jgi:hypothetical protein